MRKLFPVLAAAVVFSSVSYAIAAGADKTITGDAVCAKCALKETQKCQNVVLVKEGGKEVTYYLDGPNSMKVHKSLGICGATKDDPIRVTVSGQCEKKDGKLVLTVDKIERAKE
jgi:hypothetical protein